LPDSLLNGKKVTAVVSTCYLSDSRKLKIGELWFSPDPISKLTRAKQARGMAQAVGYLCSKNEDLSSNPNNTKKKKKLNTCQEVRTMN
jgi:hypothetical protein